MKRKITPVMLAVFNLFVLLFLCVWVRRDVETHVEDNTNLKTAWRYVRDIDYRPLEQDIEFVFQPTSCYLDHMECILINLPEDVSGNLVVEVFKGEDANGKRVARTIVTLADIVAGEWQKIPLGTWLSPSKTYVMRIGVSEAEEPPYLIYTDTEFTIVEYGGGAIVYRV